MELELQTWPRAWYPGKFNASRFYLMSASQTAQSPWTGRASVYGPHRQFWKAELTLNPFEDGSWKPLSAFFSEAGGQAGLIRMCDPARRWCQYNDEAVYGQVPWSDGTFFSDGTGWVEGGLPPFIFAAEDMPRGSNNLAVGGLPENILRALRRGDLFEVQRGGQYSEVPSLHEIGRDVGTDANGFTRLYFRPYLRKDVQAGDKIVLDHPMGTFRAIDDQQGIMDVAAPSIGRTGFTLVEAIF